MAARMVRQQVLCGDDPLKLHVILDEAVLRRPVGPPRIMRNQLEFVIEVSKLRNVVVQVIPLAAGAHPGLEGPFTILTLPEPVRDVGYAEGPQGAVYLLRLHSARSSRAT